MYVPTPIQSLTSKSHKKKKTKPAKRNKKALIKWKVSVIKTFLPRCFSIYIYIIGEKGSTQEFIIGESVYEYKYIYKL